jgi:hypothetical protein
MRPNTASFSKLETMCSGRLCCLSDSGPVNGYKYPRVLINSSFFTLATLFLSKTSPLLSMSAAQALLSGPDGPAARSLPRFCDPKTEEIYVWHPKCEASRSMLPLSSSFEMHASRLMLVNLEAKVHVTYAHV